MYKECFLKSFESFFRLFITSQNYVNAGSDKTEMLKYRILKKKKKKKLKPFQNIVTIFKINSIDFRVFGFYMSESAWDNYGKFIHQFPAETKTLIGKLERISIKLYRQNVSLLSNYIYIYI